MSGRLLTRNTATLARQTAARRIANYYHTSRDAGGLLRADARVLRHNARRFPFGVSPIHGVPAVRHASFVRNIPKLFLKLARLPAMMGGAAIAGVAYIQYQANRASQTSPETLLPAWC